MNIDNLTLGQIKEIQSLFINKTAIENNQHPCNSWKIGEIYLIRTVTMIDTGRLIAFNDHELVLEDAAWIADTGRFSDAIKFAEFDEVEPFPNGEIIIGRGSIIDAVIIKKSPRSQK